MASRTLKASDTEAKFYEDLRKANEAHTAKVRVARVKKPQATKPAPANEEQK